MSKLHRSEKAATFVALTLLAGTIAGIVLFLRLNEHDAVPLLVACVLVAFFLIVATIYVFVRWQKSEKALVEYGLPRGRLLSLLSRRQWVMLTAGLAIIAVGTGALTAVDVMTTPTAAPVPSSEPVEPPVQQIDSYPTAPAEVPSEPTDFPTGDPTESATDFPEESVSAVPAPGATTFLDSEPALDGGYDSGAVMFNSRRYLRGVSLYCSSVRSSYVQWNVAGSVRFSAAAGISDDTSEAYGIAVEMVFYDQDGRQLTPKPVEVSVGHPQSVSIPMKGVVNLRMACSARYVKSNEQTSVRAALGDPIVVHE